MDERSEAVRPLYYWPDGTDLSGVKSAFLDADYGFRVKPIGYRPGHIGPVLALEPGFPWLIDHIEPKTPAALASALDWIYGMVDLERGPRRTIDKLRAAFGEDVYELEN